jgi:hypothetical protein
MSQTTISFIARASRFSPNSVGKDMAILAAVRRQLQLMGYKCADIVVEDIPRDIVEADAYVSMGRNQDTLNWLGNFEREQIPVVNCTASVMLCNMRNVQMSIMEGMDVPVPPRIGDDGYWVKRGYGSSETEQDVQYAADYEEACRKSDEMMARGVFVTEVRAHVSGDLVKFYGVRGTDFFRCYYPGDDGDWKFPDEARNGRPHHYAYDAVRLHELMDEAAATIHLDVYGGDCIIRPDGQPVLIDLNDWPSFSRCREEAAVAIAARVRDIIRGEKYETIMRQ